MPKYDSVPEGEIYQSRPLLRKPSMFRPRSWTESIEAYRNNAKQLTGCILRNLQLRKVSNTLSVTINVTATLPVADVKDIWTKATRKMRERGVVALWVREPDERNRVNYHMIVISPLDVAEMKDIIKAAMPERPKRTKPQTPGARVVRWHMQVELTDFRTRWVRYICKAEMAGRDKRGRFHKDLHAQKRLLFKTGTTLDKFGVVGKFWIRPKAQLWKEIRDTEARIADGLEKPGVRQVVEHLQDMLGGDPNLSPRQIERRIGYWADSEGVKAWMEQLGLAEPGQNVAP